MIYEYKYIKITNLIRYSKLLPSLILFAFFFFFCFLLSFSLPAFFHSYVPPFLLSSIPSCPLFFNLIYLFLTYILISFFPSLLFFSFLLYLPSWTSWTNVIWDEITLSLHYDDFEFHSFNSGWIVLASWASICTFDTWDL